MANITTSFASDPSIISSSLLKRDQPFFLSHRHNRSVDYSVSSSPSTASLPSIHHPPHTPSSTCHLPPPQLHNNDVQCHNDEVNGWMTSPHNVSEELKEDDAEEGEMRDQSNDFIHPPPHSPPRPPPPRPSQPVMRSVERGSSGPFLRPSQHCKLVDLFRDDIFSVIFSFFDGHSTALLSCVSHAWNILLQDPIIWQHAAFHYWPDHPHSAARLPRYSNSWKRMVSERPHPRLDGIYVLETKYWKAGAERFGQKLQKIIEVTYYRYMQFFPSGRLYYALLNNPPSLTTPLPLSHKSLHPAQYLLSDGGHHIYVKVDVKHETQYMKLAMRETRGEVRGWQGERGMGGAWNRLRVVEFRGKGPRDREYFQYPLPQTEFLFYITSGIQVFAKEEEMERMKVLLESNDENIPQEAF